MNEVGIIAIGRNEGERLRRCLASVTGRGMAVVYVDSASSDGSPAIVREMGAEVVDLDMSLPFSAARARNAGFERLKRMAPDVSYVQFVDGDCEIVSGWIDAAKQSLESRADAVAVCGRRRERFPEKSIYNRVADVEWNTPVGEAKSCGGDAMMRVAAFEQAKGFDASIVAGEEPELCQRFRAAGWKILRIDAEMTLHDSAMLHFRQWWKRAIRSGYGAMDVATRFGSQGLFVKQVKSARFWTVGFSWIVIALFVGTWINIGQISVKLSGLSAGTLAGLKAACEWAGLLLLIVPLQMLRIAWNIRRRAGSLRSAIVYGILTVVGMWANVIGHRQYARDRSAGRSARMIDYKAVPSKIANETATRID